MIVTFFVAARSSAARRSSRSISRKVARATRPAYVRSTTARNRGSNYQDPVMTSHLRHRDPGSVDRMAKEDDMTLDCGQIIRQVTP